jgi:predicted RNase H-like nuclease (RuvC/YqgF family)
LDKAKSDLLKKVDVLIAKKKKLYSNVDIESPMSSDEKKLDKDIADLFSELNKLVLQKRSLKESIDEGKLPGMYVKFLAVSKKVRELEDAQKELAKKYFDEKDLNKKEAFLKQLKKGTEELKSRRRNLQDIEQTYITGLDKDVELSMED